MASLIKFSFVMGSNPIKNVAKASVVANRPVAAIIRTAEEPQRRPATWFTRPIDGARPAAMFFPFNQPF